ncbi:MFS transporter [Planctomicrobium sp. SH527]|uniref:MFS transporter n=1 Tax=Planctomicrobium sp. SH527 TaxID=3448123 RepID=UPI003F5BDAD3
MPRLTETEQQTLSNLENQASSEDQISPQPGQVIPRVVANQMLFQAGNSLTTGSFFNYFVSSFQPSAFWLAVLMILPETCQSMSALVARFYSWVGHKKKVWLAGLIIGRLASMMIPMALLFPATQGQQTTALTYILCCTVVWYLAQGISYVSYYSWLSDLAPRSRWGQLFSRRQIASLLVGVFMPLGTLALRNQFLKTLPDEAERWSYAVIFVLGGLFVLASAGPLLPLPEVPATAAQRKPVRWFAALTGNRSFGYLLASRWTAAFFQGLTQAVLFKYAYDILKIPLQTYLILISLMLLLQIPVSWWAGKLSDSNRDRRGMFLGLLLVSLSMPCWLASSAENWWWLIVAYSLWSAFALVNVCGANMCLKLAPRGNNLGHFALYEQISGLIAGMAGLLGGWGLDRLLVYFTATGTPKASAFLTLMMISMCGRILAPFWLLGVRSSELNTMNTDQRQGL